MPGHEEDFADLLGSYLVRMGFTQQELANKIGMHRNTIVKWMNRASRPASRGQVLRVADELFLSKQERKALIQAAGFSLERWPTEVWTVPQQRDMFFTGRDRVFQSLRELLTPGSTTALTQAISGLGGIGKTHMAVEYAYRFHRDYEAVLWLPADSWEVLVSACIKLADTLELPEQKETNQVIIEVQRWLRKHRHWLLILDNVENPQEILSRFVPTDHQGYVLITTRIHKVEPLAQTQVLTTMSDQEGVLFLLRRTKKIASAANLEQASTAHLDEAQQIWELMEGLPLALDQAGAYILETGCSFLAYREQYNRRRIELLDRRGKRFVGHEESVATTFSLAFEQVEALNPMAADILRASSLLHNETIPEELFLLGAEHLGPRLAIERARWDLALAVLQDYSLVQRNSDAKTLTVHRLVQAVLQDAMPMAEREVWAKGVMLAVNAAFPHVQPGTWLQCERLLPHALLAVQYIETGQVIDEEAGRLLYETASYLRDRARYAEAEPLYQRAISIFEQQLGPEHSDVAHTLNGLATLYYERGNYAEAEPLYQRAISIFEQQLGPEHSDVAYSFNGLATLYLKQGKYEEAEPLLVRAHSIREHQLRPDHPDVAYSLYVLANVYYEQGKYTEAEPLYQRALLIREQQLGPDHPDVAHSLNGLAILYHAQGRYAESESFHQRALSVFEQQLGLDHPNVARSLNNLANVYFEQGKYTEAEPLYQQALSIWEQHLGPDHPDVAHSLNNLANVYREQGRYTQAESLLIRALSIWEQQMGPVHPLVAHSLNNLAILYLKQGKYEEAEPLLVRAHSIREQQLGPEHSETAETIHSLAQLREAQGNSEEARTWYARALVVYKQALGADHPKTTETRQRLIALLHVIGQHEEAAQHEAAQSEMGASGEEQKTHPEE